MMKQRYAASFFFIAIWLIVLSIPKLRTMLYIQVAGSDLIQPASSEKPETNFYKQLAVKYPNDVRVLAKAIANETSFYGRDIAKQKATTLQYADLIKRFPNETWLVGSAVRWISSWLEDDQPNFRQLTVNSPVTRLPAGKKNFTPAELAQAIALARHGRKLEPDNSFYDWALAQFLFAGHYDEAAMKALQEGSRKQYYDDYRRDDARTLIEVRQLVRPLLTEEKLRLTWGGNMSLFRFRRVAQLVVDAAIRAEERGDNATALQTYSDLARIAATMVPGKNGDNYTRFPGMLASQIQNMAWEGANRKLPPPQWGITPDRAYPSQEAAQNDEASRTKLRAAKFAAYATENGRPDLAEEALSQAEATAEFLKSSWQTDSFDMPYGISRIILSNIATLFWISGMLLPQLLVTLLMWAGLWIVAKDREKPGEPTNRLDVIKSAVFCAVAGGVIIYAPFYLRIINQSNWPVWSYSNGTDADAALQHNLTVIAWLVALAPVVLGALFCLFETARREIEKPLAEQRLKEGWKGPAPYVRWVMAASLISSWLIYWFFYQIQAENEPWMVWTNVLALALFFYPVINWIIRCSQWLQSVSHIYQTEKLQQKPPTKPPVRDNSTDSFWHCDFFPFLRSDVGLASAMVGSWLLFGCTVMFSGDRGFMPWIIAANLLAVLFTLYGIGRMVVRLALFLRVMDRARPLKREVRPQVTLQSLHWYRQTLGAMLLVSSVAYLFLSLASLPLRRQADEKLDALIMRDEKVSVR